jgi:hypothetical protein
MQAISCKRLDLALVEPTVALATSLGIETVTSFITGYPEESAEDQAATLDLAARLTARPGGMTTSQLHLLTPEPGTALMAQYGGQLRFDGQPTDFNFPLLEPGDVALTEGDRELFATYHYYPTVLPRERHVFATAAFATLRTIARSVLRYLLRAYDGRLALLLDDADAWRQSQGIAASPIDEEFFVSFLAARFGAGHHLVSLVRYAGAICRVRSAAQGRPAPERAGPVGAGGRGLALRLGRYSEILTGIHDCPRLLRKIEGCAAAKLIDDRRAGRRTCLLVKACPENDEIATFELDPATRRLLGKFERPKRYVKFRRESAAAGERAWSWSDIRNLCESGFLEPVA